MLSLRLLPLWLRGGGLLNFVRYIILALRRCCQIGFRGFERLPADIAQFLLHGLILLEFVFELGQQFLWRALRHLLELLCSSVLFVEIGLDPKILLLVAQGRARFIRFALLQVLVMLRELSQRVGDLFLFPGGGIEFLLLRRLIGIGGALVQVLFGFWGRIPQNRHGVIRITRPLAALFGQDILLVGIAPDGVFRSCDLLVQFLLFEKKFLVLLPLPCRFLLRCIFFRIRGLFLQILRLRGQLGHHFIEFRGDICEFRAGVIRALVQ